MSLKTKLIKFLALKATRKTFKKFDKDLKKGGYKKKGRGLESPKDESKLLPLLPIIAIGAVVALDYVASKGFISSSTSSLSPFSASDFGGYTDYGGSIDYTSIPAPASYPGQANKAAAYIRSGYFSTAQGVKYKWGSRSQRLCGAGTVSALQVLGVNVRRVALAKDLGPSLIEAGYYSIGTYNIPAHGDINGNFQLGDVLVFSNHNHVEVYIPGVSGSGWVSDFFQEHVNPYSSPATVTLYRMSPALLASTTAESPTPQPPMDKHQSIMYYDQSDITKSSYNQRW